MSEVKTRDSALKALTRCMEASKKNLIDIDLVKSYQLLLDEQWARFCKAQDEVEITCGPESVEYQDTTREQGETIFLNAKSNLDRLAKVLSSLQISNND